MLTEIKFIFKLFIGQERYQKLSNNFKKKVFNDQKKLYFLHIGKCGGTNLLNSFKNSELNVISMGHRYKLHSLNSKMKYIFSYREPAERTYSAFYHIKNCGRPLHDWKQYNFLQKILFHHYEEFHVLAEDLYSKNIFRKYLSRLCINIIFQNHQPLSTWFSVNDLKKYPPQFIFDTRFLNEDLKLFNKKYGLSLSLSTNSNVVNKSTNHKYQTLSSLGKNNLEKYLYNDYKIYNFLKAEKNKINFFNQSTNW